MEDRGLYVSSKAGHHVTRFGTGTLIGAEIDLSHPGNIRWNEQAIVAIPEAEYLAHQREYDVLLADGALVKRSPQDYATFLRERDAKIKSDSEAAEAKAKAKAKEEAAPMQPPEPNVKVVDAKKFTGRKPEES